MSVKRLIYILLLLTFFSSFSQEEKRLALVIGNSNYDKGELKNPVKDANLIAQTLDSLNFDIILATNLEDQRSFLNTIREFGDRRGDYDVGFVYYAGHGVQIAGENYLLPTKEIYESKNDIEDYAVNVAKIMKYLTAMTNQVNILILDACRNNPFEQNWNATRSLKGGGLAKIPPPTGSLIAFSTDAGNTAADGDGENSIYCKSLVKNMLLENTTLDQVFRNVRTDVLNASNNMQRPIESSQLTGDAFYLVKSDYEEEFKEINDLMEKKNHLEVIEMTSKIIGEDPKNKRAFLIQGINYHKMKYFYKAIESFDRAIEIDQSYISAISERSIVYLDIAFEKYAQSDSDQAMMYFHKSLEEINKAIEIDNSDASLYNRRGIVYHFYLDDLENGFSDYNKSIELDSLFLKPYMNLAVLQKDQKEWETALELYNKSIDLCVFQNCKNQSILYENRARYYLAKAGYNLTELEKINDITESQLEEINLALDDCMTAISTDKNYAKPYKIAANIHWLLDNKDKYVYFLKRYIELQPKNNLNGLTNIYDSYIQLNEYDYALETIDRMEEFSSDSNFSDLRFSTLLDFAIDDSRQWLPLIKLVEFILESSNDQSSNEKSYYYYILGESFLELSQSEDLSVKLVNQYINKSLESLQIAKQLNNTDPDISMSISRAYRQKEDLERAKNILLENLELFKGYKYEKMVYNNLGVLQNELGEYEKSIKSYTKAIEIRPDTDTFVNRGNSYDIIEEYELAINDYYQAINLNDSENMDKLNIWYQILNLYIEIKDYKNALEVSKEIIEQESMDPDVYYKIAIIYLNQNNYIKSLINISKSIALFSDEYYITKYREIILSDSYTDIISNDGSSRDDITKIELILERAKILILLDFNLDACEDYNAALELIDEDSDARDEIEELISKNCNN